MITLLLTFACSDYNFTENKPYQGEGGQWQTEETVSTEEIYENYENHEETVDQTDSEDPVFEPQEHTEETTEMDEDFVVANIQGNAEFLYASDFGWSQIDEAHGWYDNFIQLPTTVVEETRFVCGLNVDSHIECECVGQGDCEQYDGKTANYIPNKEYVQVSNARNLLCGLEQNGTVDCWDTLGREFPMEGSYNFIRANNHEVCGIKTEDSSVVCFDKDPQLGYWANYTSNRVFNTITGQGVFCGMGQDFVECWENDNQRLLVENIQGLVQMDSNEEIMCYEDNTGIHCHDLRNTGSGCVQNAPQGLNGELRVFSRTSRSASIVNPNTETVWGDIVCQ